MGLKDIVEISNKYGKNPEFVLAGGGNTSYKDEKNLYIKASGTTLANITCDGFAELDRESLAKMWTKKYPDNSKEREAEVLEDLMNARTASSKTKRPSVETSLHDIFPQTYVVHLHPAIVNGITCGINGQKVTKELFPDAIWIPEIEPGWTLAVKVKEEFDKKNRESGKTPSIIILENHGIFVAGNTEKEIDDTYSVILNSIESRLEKKPDISEVEFDKERAAYIAPAIRMMLKDGATSIVTAFSNSDIASFIKDKNSFYPVSSAYTPDHIVYCKPYPLFIEKREDISEQTDLIKTEIETYKNKYGYAPRIIAVEGLCVFAHGSSKKNADTAKTLFIDTAKIAVFSQSFGGPKFMSEKFITFITNWEVESYRSSVASGIQQKRIAEKVTIVTGAAQGFGQGIAECLLDNGCNMVIADMNIELSQKNANEYNEKYGTGKAIAVGVNVGDEDSVLNMIIETVLAYGGVDMLVSNAGIARSGNIEQTTKQSLEFHTLVNYTGFFLCSKYASRIMKIQYKYAPSEYFDIVQVNSKSGLEGSNKNFAYAGSKFGGIGLVQSFALELVEFNIKVNAVCPGNFLDGPLWSDPEKGLFVQYLNSGKVPGAKTVDDVRKAYEAKVPMNRGCFPHDVAVAIMYCMEQKYETGQAIPVTGGQVMLK